MCKQAVMAVTERFTGMLGLARRAGKTVQGTDMICEKMRAKKKPVLVLVSHSASDATRERLMKKCVFYNIPCLVVNLTTEVLGHLLGKSGAIAAVAVTDEGFARELTAECKST